MKREELGEAEKPEDMCEQKWHMAHVDMEYHLKRVEMAYKRLKMDEIRRRAVWRRMLVRCIPVDGSAELTKTAEELWDESKILPYMYDDPSEHVYCLEDGNEYHLEIVEKDYNKSDRKKEIKRFVCPGCGKERVVYEQEVRHFMTCKKCHLAFERVFDDV